MNTTLATVLLIIPTIAFGFCILDLLKKDSNNWFLSALIATNAMIAGSLAYEIGSLKDNGRPCTEKDLPTNTIQTPVGISEYRGKTIVIMKEEDSNILRAVFTTRKMNIGQKYNIKTTPDGEMLLIRAEKE